jgi:hypothetical protein
MRAFSHRLPTAEEVIMSAAFDPLRCQRPAGPHRVSADFPDNFIGGHNDPQRIPIQV